MRRNNKLVVVKNDEATDFVNKYHIKADFAEFNWAKKKSQKSLIAIETKSESEYMNNLISIDVKLPLMNGWEFLEHYKEPNEELLSQMMIVMLTTSLKTDERVQYKSNDSIDQFMRKLLTIEMLEELDLEFSGLAS